MQGRTDTDAAPLLPAQGSSEPKPDTHGRFATNSWFQSGMIVIANMLGAGVLGLPYACSLMGWIPSIVILVLITAFSIYGGLLLGWLRGDDNHIVTYGQLADKVARSVGLRTNVLRHFVQIIGYVYVIGSLTIYLTTCRLSLMQMFQECPTNSTLPSSCGGDSCTKHAVTNLPNAVWLVIAAAVLYPVIQIRSLSETGIVSYIGVGTIAVVNFVVLGHLIWDASKHHSDKDASTHSMGPASLRDFVNGVTQLAFAYGGHVLMVDIQSVMKQPRDWPKSVYFSQTFMFTNYAIIGFLGYSVYGENNMSSVITSKLADNWLRVVVNVCLFVHVGMAYCINSTVVTTYFVNLFFPGCLAASVEVQKRKAARKTGHKQEAVAADNRDHDGPLLNDKNVNAGNYGTASSSNEDSDDNGQQQQDEVGYAGMSVAALEAKARGVWWKWMLVTTGILGVSYLIGSIIPFFGDLMNVYSSLGIFSLSFFAPVLFWVLLSGGFPRRASARRKAVFAMNIFLIAIAVVGCGMGVWAAIMDILHNWKVCHYHF